MSKPLVTIICTVYNHFSYLDEVIDSVLNQNYRNFELIIIDNNSSDDSKNWLINFKRKKPTYTVILNDENFGVCKAFNQGLTLSKGKYIIDLAADDVLYPDSLTKKIAFFELQESLCNMIYSDAEYIDEKSNSLGIYSKLKNVKKFPSGAIFNEILFGHFICPPSVMFRTDALKKVGGYDESLAYEDFDIWLRLSKVGLVAYQDEVTIKRRISDQSFSNQFYGERRNVMLKSTLKICEKVERGLEGENQKKALVKRVKYEFRYAMRQNQGEVVKGYSELLKRLGEQSFVYKIFSCFY